MQISARSLLAIKWFGTVTGLVGAAILALNIPISGWGWVLFALSSVSWTAAALMMREWSLAMLQGGFLAVDLVGIWRWLLA